MKKDTMVNMKMVASLALAGIGVGSLLYSYTKMHPIKTQKAINDIKSMVKDLK